MEGHLILVLFLLGIAGVLKKDNLVKKIIALNILNTSLIMLFVYLGSLSGDQVPILLRGVTNIVDPIPQALMLTDIVIGICVTALALVLVQKMYKSYKTLSLRRIEEVSKSEHD